MSNTSASEGRCSENHPYPKFPITRRFTPTFPNLTSSREGRVGSIPRTSRNTLPLQF